MATAATATECVYLLREFISANKPIAATGTHILFDKKSYPRQTITGVHASANVTQYLTLEALWFVAQTSSSTNNYSDYFKAANVANVAKVSFADRPVILAWLKGETDTLALLDAAPTVAFATSAAPSASAQATQSAQVAASEASSLYSAPELSAEERRVQRERAIRLEERAAALLAPLAHATQPAEATAGSGPSSSSEGPALTGETLQRLREKFSTRTRSGAAGVVQDDDLLDDSALTATGGEDALLATSRRVLAQVRAREASALGTLRVLQAPAFRFEKMLKSVHELREKELSERQQQQTQAFDRVRQIQAQQHDRYNVDSSSVWGGMAKELAEIGIDTGASMLARAASNAPASFAAPSSSSSLSTSSSTSSSSSSASASSSTQQRKTEKRAREDSEGEDGRAKKRHRSSGSGSGSSQGAEQPSIIIVPERYLLTTSNVREWLIDERFTPAPSDKKSPASVELQRAQSTKRFVVVHDARALSSSDWERVVAVFVQGQAWQFKGWKYATPAELFGHVKGYYLHYDDQKVPPEIKSWNVRPLPVSRVNAHSGAKAAAMFWSDVDDLLAIKRGGAKA